MFKEWSNQLPIKKKKSTHL